MKKIGIMVVFLVFLTAGLIFAQEVDQAAVCQVFMGSSANTRGGGEIKVSIDTTSGSWLYIDVENRIRNGDVEITDVEVDGMTAGGRSLTEEFSGSKIKYDKSFIEEILPRTQSGKIRVELKYIKKVTEVRVYADICEL
jgi:hypothetical protein